MIRTEVSDRTFVIAGYLPDYRLTGWVPPDTAALTDLIYFSVEPPADGVVRDDILTEDVLSRLHALQRELNCRLLLCVGGGRRSEGFAELAGDADARDRFIEGASRWCLDHGFAGIDYDWEHPQGDHEVADYADLITATKRRFEADGLIVTVAQATWLDLGQPVYEAVDRVHLMSYNHPYPQATLMKSWIDVQRVLGWGCPPEKLVLGVPFYGRNEAHEAKPYRDLIADRQLDPATDQVDGYAFNGPETIRSKKRYAAENGLAGVMVWELGQDAVEERSLLRILADAMYAP